MSNLFPPLSVTSEVTNLLTSGAPVALGVSGGKDSSATALATMAYLDDIGHTGPRLLIHSDLGRVEWKASLPMCQRLAEHLDLELVVVRRTAGDLLDRWRVRWHNNVERYRNLECVKLILPWSTPSMRFCTSELKTAVICRELMNRYPGCVLLSASGIRREESAARKHAPIACPQPKLMSVSRQTSGLSWHPLLTWTRDDVLRYHQYRGFPLHEAYTRYQTSRVSCVFCMLASQADLIASATCEDNHDIYREMVRLEIASSFSFQDHQWLGDSAPHLLDEELQEGLVQAKRRAAAREASEARIPKHLLYTKGWPSVMPTGREALLLSEVRSQVADIMGFSIAYSDPDAILERYAALLALKAQKRKQASQPVVTIIQEELWSMEVLA